MQCNQRPHIQYDGCIESSNKLVKEKRNGTRPQTQKQHWRTIKMPTCESTMLRQTNKNTPNGPAQRSHIKVAVAAEQITIGVLGLTNWYLKSTIGRCLQK